MSRIKIPTREEVLELAQQRADICVSIYVDTSPLKLHKEECRIDLRNLIRQAVTTLKDAKHNKRRIAALEDMLDAVAGADDFCEYQANTLAILATPDSAYMYRLANDIHSQIEVSDRFYLKPLYRALTFSHTAYILALSDNEAKLIELFAEADPEVVKVPGMPRDAMHALGLKHLKASIRVLDDSGDSTRKRRLAQYSRKVDDALRAVMWGCDAPVILAAAEPLAPIFRSVASICLVEEGINGSPDKIPYHELVDMARPILDRHYAKEIADIKYKFQEQEGIKRVATRLEDVAHAATYGMVNLVLVDFDVTVTGMIDENGDVRFSNAPESYGLIDEIVKRAVESGAKVMAVRSADMIGNTGVAAILRFPLPQNMPPQEELEALSASQDGV